MWRQDPPREPSQKEKVMIDVLLILGLTTVVGSLCGVGLRFYDEWKIKRDLNSADKIDQMENSVFENTLNS
jgi:hypothetical protein